MLKKTVRQTSEVNSRLQLNILPREILDWIFWVLLRKIIVILPQKVTYYIASILGGSLKTVQRSYLKSTYDKYSHILKEQPASLPFQKIINNGIINHIKKEIEVFYFPDMAKKVEKWISIDGKNNLDSALKINRGVILLHLHFGAIHIPILALGNLGYNITQVGVNPLFLSKNSKENMSYFARKVWEIKLFYEKILPADFIYIGTSMKKIFSCLKNNGIIDMAADGRKGSQDITTRFVGQNISFSLGPFRIAKKSGAIILPTFVIRNSNNTHKLIIESPIYPEGLDVEEMLGSFFKTAEGYVYKYPCHYIRMLKTLCTDKNIS